VVFAILLVATHPGEFRQPILAADGPKFICRAEDRRVVQAPEVDANLILDMRKNRRAAGWAEATVAEAADVACDRHGGFGKDRRGVELGSVVLAAVHEVADPDTVGLAGGSEAQCPAEATTGHAVHVSPPAWREPRQGQPDPWASCSPDCRNHSG